MTKPSDVATPHYQYVDYDKHPDVMRAFRWVNNNAGWLDEIVERTWYQLGSLVNVPEKTPDKLTLLGGGEMGYALSRVKLLGSFPVGQAKQQALDDLGVGFRQTLRVESSRLQVRKTGKGEQISLVLDSARLPIERDATTNAVDAVARRALKWKYLTEVSFKIADINAQSGNSGHAANVDPDDLRDIGRSLPAVIHLEPGEIEDNLQDAA